MKQEVKSYGKVNLALNVIRKKTNNYHEIDTIMVPYKKIWDTLSFEIHKSGNTKINLENKIKNQHISIEQEDNLVYKAIELLRKKTNFKEGITVHIAKEIPLGSGMGGGSSNAGETLLFLNEQLNLNLSIETLSDLGLKLGSDVPYFLCRGAARVTGQGEKVTPLSFENFFNIDVFLNPDYQSSTKKIFNHLDLSKTIHPKIDDVEKALLANNYTELLSSMFNSLETVLFILFPELQKRYFHLHKNKKYDLFFITGSGSSFVGITISK